MAAQPFSRTTSRLAALIALLFFVLGCNAGPGSPLWTPASGTAAPFLTPAPTPTPEPTAPPAFPITITDDEGTVVTIAAEPQKIVSLTPATTETLFALGVGSRVVGKVEDIASYPPEAASVPIVATFSGVDVEKIISLGADLVVSGGAGLTQGAAVEQLRRASIPVVVSYPTTIDKAIAGFRLLGQAVGAADAGNRLADDTKSKLAALAATAATATVKPRLFYEIDASNGIFTPPAESIYGEMFTLAGAQPISGNANYSISLEDLVNADPEVILLGDAATAGRPTGVTAESVAARSGWGGMTAVKNGSIFPIDDIVVTRPGPRLVDGLAALIAAIHPELAPPSPGPSTASSAPASTAP
ncbi:MAG TPA: ABC transporter substrate-binding protein [Patescibacteria group bacterium]|nr:ABC transporter substrate-binding protein [Patescibacteria group bacterium]